MVESILLLHNEVNRISTMQHILLVGTNWLTDKCHLIGLTSLAFLLIVAPFRDLIEDQSFSKGFEVLENE